MNAQPWNRETTHKHPAELSERERAEFAAFNEWEQGVEKWIIDKWTEETGVIASSEPLHQWAWTAGANLVFEHHAAELIERLATMPAFPTVCPSNRDLNHVCARLSLLDAREPVTLDKDTLLRSAKELRRQAIHLLQLADETEDASEALHGD